MQRIVYVVARMFGWCVYYFFSFKRLANPKHRDYKKMAKLLHEASGHVNKAGKIVPTFKGVENLPEKDGFIVYPNHQGLFDVILMYSSCEKEMAFVVKKEASNIFMFKDLIKAIGSLVMDRSDIRQSIKIIQEVTEQVKAGRNFIIFAEGTRSKQGNVPGSFKGGSFKAATNAKCPIVPCALLNCYKVFDEKGVKPVEVTVKYLKPIMYEEYKDMKGQEIADMVKARIEEAIKEETSNYVETTN